MGITTITDMGILVENIVKATDNTVSFGTISAWNWLSFAWWAIATMIVTPYLLKEIIGMLLTEKFVENKLVIAVGIASIFGIYEIGIDSVYFINNLIN